MLKYASCAFTGHREDKLNLSEDAWSEIRKMIYDAIIHVHDEGACHFICGMANGADLCFGECVVRAKEFGYDITLEAAIPYAGQASNWSEAERARYKNIIENCDKVTILQERYTRGCMMERNKYMVDNAAILIAVYNGSSGGTQNTMLYAMRSGVEIIEIEVH